MTTILDNIRHYTQNHPLFVAAGVVSIVPGTYIFIFGRRPVLEFEHTFLSHALTPASDIKSAVLPAITAPSFGLSNSPAATFAYRLANSARNRIEIIADTFEERNRIEWGVQYSFCRILWVAITTALPAIFILGVCQFPNSWASRHQIAIANGLHCIALANFANHRFEDPDLLVAALVMVAFDVFQRARGREAADATDGGESEHQPQAPSAVETLKAETQFVLAKSEPKHDAKEVTVESGGLGATLALQSRIPDTKPTPTNPELAEVVRHQRRIIELKTANQAKEVQLRNLKADLHNARETLNATFEEYSNLREELKTIKQTVGSDHQAIIYRKDIELFALRKANNQKENYMKEHDAKLEDMHRQHKATIEIKDAQLRLLKDRLNSMDHRATPKVRHETRCIEGADHALEVRLLRVKKAKETPSNDEEEKDVVIANLREDLAVATRAAEAVVNQQAELQRAWDIAKKVQSALKEEKEKHSQTREQLQEATVKLSEKEGQKFDIINFNGRLPTIDEDEHDTQELEAMFDTAQEDNLRLYTEVEMLEKRLRDANARMFAAEQCVESLKEQVRLEQAINDDLELARPSVVHHVQFQRLEGQLKASQDARVAKDEEIDVLKNTIVERDRHVKDLQDEIECLKQIVSGLQVTKEQLMLDHERLASQRTRQRVVTADRTSARSSGATLIQELSPQQTRRSDEPAPVEAVPPLPSLLESDSNESIQLTPKRHLRSVSTPNRWSLISDEVPPPQLRELKSSRRKSLGFKDLVKRIVRKDEKSSELTTSKEEKVNENMKDMRSACAPEETNTHFRPATATPATAITDLIREQPQKPTRIPALYIDIPSKSRTDAPRYITTQVAKADERSRTATADEALRPVSRRSWAATNKLKRRSLY